MAERQVRVRSLVVHGSHRCRPGRTTAEVIAWFFRCSIDSFSAVMTVSLSITLTRLYHASFMDLSSLAVEQFGSTQNAMQLDYH